MHARFGINKFTYIYKLNATYPIKIFTVACPSGVTVLEANISASKVRKGLRDQETVEPVNAG